MTSAANLYALFRARFPRDRSRPFLRTPEGRTVTYDDVARLSARLQSVLTSRVEPGARVMVQVEKSPEAVLLYLACLRAGAIYVPLNPAYGDVERAHFLTDAEPALIVCEPEDEAKWAALVAEHAANARILTLGPAGEGGLMAAAEHAADAPDIAARGGEDIAAILYTSGTTGRPKGAMLSHANLAANARTLHRAWGFRPDEVLLHVLPIYHTHGLFVACHCVLLNGSSMLFLPRFDAATAAALMPQAQVFMGVPTHYVRLLAEPAFDAEAAQGIRLFVSGSAPLLEDTFTAFEARTGQRILERYGMTETGMNTSNPLAGPRIAGTVGPPLPEVDVRVSDAEGRVLAAGEIGVLEVRGPNVFKGYWRRESTRSEDFRADGFFVTGDLARVGADGYVAIVGRAKDLIISGGLNVYPKEVEAAIDALGGVYESAVIGAAHPDLGEAVLAVVVGEPGLKAHAVIDALGERLAGFKRPKDVVFVPELPRNAMGKVEKAALRRRYGGHFG